MHGSWIGPAGRIWYTSTTAHFDHDPDDPVSYDASTIDLMDGQEERVTTLHIYGVSVAGFSHGKVWLTVFVEGSRMGESETDHGRQQLIHLHAGEISDVGVPETPGACAEIILLRT